MERFIISTGRSGSTLLTQMVAENRNLLVLNEFMSAMDPVHRFSTDPVSGREFARIMTSTCDVAVFVYERAMSVSERLDHGSGGREWPDNDNIMPSLAATVYPTLTEDPVGLFDESIVFARSLPRQTMHAHYIALFGWLAKVLGKKAWLERSGLSMRWLPEWRAIFPDARYLHIHRSGVEAALSMMNHPWFVLSSQYENTPPTREEIERAVQSCSKSIDDPVGRFYHEKPPIEYFGWNWSYAMLRGFREFQHLDRDQLTDIRFERLMADPMGELTRLAAFFDLPEDEAWIERAAGLVKADVPGRAHKLDPQDRGKLEQACLPGDVLTGRRDPNRLMETYRTIREVRPRARLD